MTNKKLHKTELSYQAAGVDIDKANRLVDDIKQIAKRTHRPGVLTGIGGFGALFELPLARYQHPVLVSGTDGVGTKLKLAIAMQRHDTIGIDLVAMCVNDIITLGAEPLFFLDYFATGQLNPAEAKAILSGIGEGCEQAGMALIGGETAEMPGLYQGNEYDLAGFCVGIVEKAQILTGDAVQPGNQLIALASSGPHSNGYSLIRRVIEDCQADLNAAFGKQTLGETLLAPTKIYAKSLQTLQKDKALIHACAHITGGGLLENIPRVLPNHCKAVINQSSWQWPEIFTWIQNKGQISTMEMYRTFNVGVGMVLIIEANQTEHILQKLQQLNEKAWVLGTIQSRIDSEDQVEIQP